MKFKSYDNEREIELLDCPFCGGEPRVRHIGNDHSKSRKIEVYCIKCRIKRVDSAMRNGFDWLENVAADSWNLRA